MAVVGSIVAPWHVVPRYTVSTFNYWSSAQPSRIPVYIDCVFRLTKTIRSPYDQEYNIIGRLTYRITQRGYSVLIEINLY